MRTTQDALQKMRDDDEKIAILTCYDSSVRYCWKMPVLIFYWWAIRLVTCCKEKRAPSRLRWMT